MKQRKRIYYQGPHGIVQSLCSLERILSCRQNHGARLRGKGVRKLFVSNCVIPSQTDLYEAAFARLP